MGTGYCEKSPVPSALSPTPQVLGANVLQDTLENPRNRRHPSNSNENDNSESRNDIDNPVFGETNENSYGATIKSTCNYKKISTIIDIIFFHLSKSLEKILFYLEFCFETNRVPLCFDCFLIPKR